MAICWRCNQEAELRGIMLLAQRESAPCLCPACYQEWEQVVKGVEGPLMIMEIEVAQKGEPRAEAIIHIRPHRDVAQFLKGWLIKDGEET